MRKVNGPFIVAAAALSAGCQSFQHARDIEQSALVEMDAARQQWHKHSAPRRAAQTVQYAAQQWIFPTPFTEAKAPPLGCELDIVSAEPVSLSEFSQLITRKCGMSVRLTRDALTAVSRPRASDINHHGRLEALLDAVTARAGLAWQFDPDRRRVTIAALSSRTFPVHLIATDTDMKSEFHSGTTQVNGVLSAGSDSGQGGQGAAHTLQSTTVQLKTSLWKDIQHDIETIAPPPDNHISVSPATGSLTVAGAPDVLDRVQRYVDARNKQFDKFVTFQVHVVSVTISNTDAIGLRWSALYQTLAGKYGIELAQPFAAPASASAATFSILKTSVSPWAGTQAILHALNEQGHARLVRSTQLATMNLNPVATQTGAQEGYLASSNTTQTAQVGSTTTLSPGTINTGFNISMLPYVLEDNQILLRMNINLSSQKGPPRVIESGGARIELPSIALPLNTSNTIKVRAGDTVMLAAQEDIDDRAQRSGVGSSAFFALGGGVQAAQSRTLLVVLITPVLMQDSSHGRIFVSNLFWQPLPNPRTAIQDARAFGIQNGWTWGVIRSGARAQAGFAECGHEVRTLKGTLSLAAQLAAQLGDAWLGAFKVAEGRYAVIAVHERWIIPGFDVVCDAGQAAQLWLEAMRLYTFDASACFASPELGLSANARDIAPLLAMRQWHSESQIKRLRWRDAYPRRMIAGAVLALAGFALVGYWLASMRSRPASQPGVRAQRALRASQNTLNGAPSAQRLPDRAYPWMRQASAQAFARACTTAIGALPLNLAGWRFDHARCKESIVTVQLNRETGATVEGLINALARLNSLRPLFDGHDQALLHIPIKPEPEPADNAAPPAARLISGFVSHFQRYGIQPELKPVARPSPLQASAQGSRQAQDWQPLRFDIQSAQSPVFHFGRLARRGLSAGVRIRAITATLQQARLGWQVEGMLYVQKES